MENSALLKIKERLDKTILELEKQTAALKEDLIQVNQLLEDGKEEISSAGNELKKQLIDSKIKLDQHKDKLENLTEGDLKSTGEEYISELERETISMLKRMQDKVNSNSVLADLYNDIQKNKKDTAVSEPTVNEISPEEEMRKIQEERDLENKVEEFRKADALNELKNKLKGNKKDQ